MNKARIWLLSAILPVSALVLVLGVVLFGDDTHQQAAVRRAADSELPAWVQEPLPILPDTDADLVSPDSPGFSTPGMRVTVSEINNSLRRSIRDSFRDDLEAQLNR